MTIFLAAFAFFVGLAFSRDRGSKDVRGELIIFHAGSLSVPFREVSKKFNEIYPDVSIKAEAAGSRDTARKVSDLGRYCDVLGSADYEVIDNLLIPQHATFSIRFAANEMVIAYTKQSRQCALINAENWPDVLLSENVAFGRSDPNRDPCGYRTEMTFQLAEKHYEMPGLANRLIEKGGRKYIRPKETDLLALLEAGEIDYLFIYRSVATQHGLEFILLPDAVNLKLFEQKDLYATASVRVTGRQPGEFIERKGAPMVYGVTIPINCRHRELAEAWVALLLSPTGQKIMERSGQPVIAPALTAQYDELPDVLKPLCKPMGEAR
ncbi:MAG: tungstate ABC transporter substrate-binding protein WtpA [Candidatus Latescibacteria bacterium]|nr:tungstate ABC transporter substrate-binding protein WtpA [Candidatus Latescibacterota bacterium]NIM66325.1 tungstate ABC transporter substrate-binding protein WtpA [Candidatus Latescibacterota bacterium]NIO02804.1 tungstate ABC transporter substrate-binding protein WtpA [Candidatus Latescibacterota bacterium]NIO29939.1 tungstate ABC transporter substrate-binding protein WtpA [Candidatus Latescibacterota bacterium]NIO57554.1 tungstate ABC transporter substrate-binding protein WtpA [Candidatus